MDIAAYLGVHRNTVSDWWQQYQQAGEAALEQQPRGNKLGEGFAFVKPTNIRTDVISIHTTTLVDLAVHFD